MFILVYTVSTVYEHLPVDVDMNMNMAVDVDI
jgi:hypothetical protein